MVGLGRQLGHGRSLLEQPLQDHPGKYLSAFTEICLVSSVRCIDVLTKNSTIGITLIRSSRQRLLLL